MFSHCWVVLPLKVWGKFARKPEVNCLFIIVLHYPSILRRTVLIININMLFWLELSINLCTIDCFNCVCRKQINRTDEFAEALSNTIFYTQLLSYWSGCDVSVDTADDGDVSSDFALKLRASAPTVVASCSRPIANCRNSYSAETAAIPKHAKTRATRKQTVTS